MAERMSIRPTYDSRETGPRYHVTVRVNSRTLVLRHRTPDPFVNQRVIVGWRDLLTSLLRRRAVVEVIVDGDRDVIEDVLDLDGDYLGPGQNTRRQAWNAHLNEAIGRFITEGNPS